MADLKHKSGVFLTKAAPDVQVGEREAVFIMSTNDPDRHGDVVEQEWELRDFRKNPVFLFQHNSSALPIGRISKIWSSDDKTKTFAKAEGTPEGMDDLADKVWKFIKTGFLNAVSVGFLPVDDPQPRRNKNGDFVGYTFPRNALLELSAVSVPAAPGALAIARSMHLSDSETKQIFTNPAGVSARVGAAKRFAELQRLRVRN